MCQVDYSDNPPVFVREEKRKTRRCRRCESCGQWIPTGDFCLTVSGRWQDSGFKAFVLCRWCEIRADWLGKQCGGYLFETVCEDFEEHFENREDGLRVIFEKLGCLV